jgi:hypothetical protein
VDFASIDFLLFGVAFLCVWLALFGARQPKLALFVLGAWIAHHVSVEAFSNTAHLEILELAFLSIALLLAARGHSLVAGTGVGLAIATKTLPALFLPYLVISRSWRMLAGAVAAAAIPFLLVCWMQGISVWDGLSDLIYQGGNLTGLEYTEYEYTPRAEIARMLANETGALTPAQTQLAISIHWILGIATAAFAAWVVLKSRVFGPRYGLLFGLIGVVMLVMAPSAHPSYYVFLLPGWTAILAALLGRPLSLSTLAQWLGLIVAYVFTGFDQPFFLMQRLFGFGVVVPQHWLAWHLPSIGLLVTLVSLAVLLLMPNEQPDTATRPLSWLPGYRRWRLA